MSICPKNKSSKGRRDKRRANHTVYARTADLITKKRLSRRINKDRSLKIKSWRFC